MGGGHAIDLVEQSGYNSSQMSLIPSPRVPACRGTSRMSKGQPATHDNSPVIHHPAFGRAAPCSSQFGLLTKENALDYNLFLQYCLQYISRSIDFNATCKYISATFRAWEAFYNAHGISNEQLNIREPNGDSPVMNDLVAGSATSSPCKPPRGGLSVSFSSREFRSQLNPGAAPTSHGPKRLTSSRLASVQLIDKASAQQLLANLSRLIEGDEVPCEARLWLSGAAAFYQLGQSKFSSDEGQKLVRILLGFLPRQAKLAGISDWRDQFSKRFPVSAKKRNVDSSDLDPRTYTTKQLSEILHLDESNIRRKAALSWQAGPGPQPLIGHRGWYVTGQGSAAGGRRCGWQFQKLRKPDAD